MAENRRTCASCGTTNEEDARFCEACGGSLARVCATCGLEARASARFCRGCGAPLEGQVTAQEAPAAGPVRKTVTVMFADLAGSTSFEETVDVETARDVIGRYHDLLRSIAQRHRAGMTKYIGDGFMAVWGVPEISPDDATHAVDAAAELQERFVELAARVAETHGVELALRVAVNTGEVVVGEGDADLVGDALNVGARLEAECPLGRVVVGEETWRATRGRYGYESLGQVQVRGRTAPVAVYQWRGRRTETPDATPLVGRADEIRRLQSVFDDAVAARAARLVTVIGDPGVGKSRLASEFTAAQGEVRVLEARCLLEGTVALAPMVEVLRALKLETDIPATVPERDRLLRDLNGLVSGDAGSVEENFWALRRFVEVLGANRPVLLILDDIQWADTLLLDFIEHLVEWVHEIPVFALALARPELRESRPDLVTVSRWVSEAVHLGGLDARATAELAAKVLGAARLPDDLLRRLPASTGGNPLFVRELIGMLAHDGVLVEQPTGWRLTIDVDAIAIPPTIHALLASRLERLERSDRRVLEIASVVGSDFSLGVVRALAGSAASGVESSLNRLRRRELVQPSGAYAGDEPVWRFHHVLIRDVAYRRLLKSDRADLHEQLADWVETGGPSVAFNADEMIARHLEAAHTYRLELGTVDEHTSGLALRSARRYAASARRALDRDELVSAGNQAARGAALATADEALHADLLLTGCEAFLSAGDVAAGAPLVEDLERIADEALSPWAVCYRCQFTVYTEPARLPEVDALLQGAIDEFSRRRDHAGLAKAHRVRAGARARLGRIGDCEADLFEALIAARQSGDHRQITAALGAAPGAALWGPSPVPKAGGRCLDVVRMQRMTTAAPSLEATSLRHLAVLELLRGRPDKARAMLADAHQVVSDLGLRHGLMETELFAGIIESMEGDPAAAEPHFRTALDGLQALGLGADAGQAAALLAKSVLAQGGVDEADAYAAESERLAGRNLKSAIAWRAVRAEILAAHGRHQDAVAMAREAVEVAAGTDLVLDHADACLTLSRILAKAGDEKGADTARDNATALYAAKEVTSGITRASAPVVPMAPPSVTTSAVSRLVVRNLASVTGHTLIEAMRAGNIDAAAALYSDRLTQDDRRRLSGDPIQGRAEARAALGRLGAQYSHFDSRILAVRGEHLALSHNHWSDDDGNETIDLIVAEVDDDGLIIFQGRFDEDFDGAYRELDRRYYAGEGAAFAEGGSTGTEWTLALNRNDFDAMFDEFMTSDFCIKNRSRSSFPDRSAAEYRTTLEELTAMVVSSRSWSPVMRWLSPTCFVARCEREAVGADGEHYNWIFVIVFEFRDGRIASMCEFDPDDEYAAFAYAEERVRPTTTTSRLAVTNRASALADAAWRALQLRDAEAAVGRQRADFVYDDRRRLSGDPIAGPVELRAATDRILEQYPHTEWRTLAVRGERLEMRWQHLWDDAGNEATTLNVLGFDEDGQLEYFGRFDEDDFEGAYLELEGRYYSGEGSAYAAAGMVSTESICALNHGDFDRLLHELSWPDMRVENRTRSAFPDRSIGALHASFGELDALVDSSQTWLSAVHWISPNWYVSRLDRRAIGRDGEHYEWMRILVVEVRGGRNASMCEFELEDEAAAFAYAKERVQAPGRRFAVTNRAKECFERGWKAMRTRDAAALLALYADRFVFDDGRRLSGDPIVDPPTMLREIERVLDQYSAFEFRPLAVRGERFVMGQSRWSDDAGNESTHLHVAEVDDDGRIAYHARFDDDDFEGAYSEFESRYYAGEGAAFAEGGAVAITSMAAMNRGDFDRMFGAAGPNRPAFENRSRSLFPNRSAGEVRAGFEELNAMVASMRTWLSVVRWLSPGVAIGRFEREAVGHDGELYAWTRLNVTEICDGQVAAIHQFDIEDEDAAFACAAERMRATASRLAVTNRSCEFLPAFVAACRAHDIDGVLRHFSDRFVYDDRRGISGDPVVDLGEMRTAIERVFDQYTRFESHVLAVRGQRLHLQKAQWADDDGNETTTFYVMETGDDGRIVYHARFDEDDFESAYRELERRYYAGEGAASAEGGATAAATFVALCRGDYDRVFADLVDREMHIENRSRSAFGDRSAGDLRSSWGELDTMISSVRIWPSAVWWLSPRWSVTRIEREAVGHDGESYSWTFVLVGQIEDSRIMSLCQFELEDEDAAFAYAKERMRATARRLDVRNRASDTADAAYSALRARDVEGMVANFSDHCLFEDRRRLSGNPIDGIAGLRANIRRLVGQYSRFDWRTLAVRGERLVLVSSHISSDEGFETSHLFVCETGVDGLITYQCTFDGEDFEGAYREFERRYFAEEGSAFADAGTSTTEFVLGLSHGDPEGLSTALSAPGLRVENRSRSAFGDRSAAEFRASFVELNAMVTPVRTYQSAVRWLSPTLFVGRFEREAVGHDDEQYTWTHLHVVEIQGGRITCACLFDHDDEDAAFAYAEERLRATTSKLQVSNLSSDVAYALTAALRAGDADDAMRRCSDRMVYEDHRRLSGDPIRSPAGFRAAFERIMQQYSDFERSTLAVRGDKLNLNRTRWSDGSGNESCYLHVHEVDGDGRIVYEGRFDEDDFEGAYRTLSERFYAGEGAAFAEGGTAGTEYMMTYNKGDFDRLVGELTHPETRFENRSHSVIPDRSAAELRETAEELSSMVSSSRTWNSVEVWLSPNWCIHRFEREAAGLDDEQYKWTWIYVTEFHDGQMVSSIKFDLEDEEAAFAYAEERVLAAASRQALRNRASRTADALMKAMNAASVTAALDCFSDQFVYLDRRRLSGEPIRDKDELPLTATRILQQYNLFDTHILAVRGERLSLDRGRWSNDAGFETIQLSVNEVDDAGQIIYQIRFDENDFEGAYRELDKRYYAGEGAAFSEQGPVLTEWQIALNQRDFDRLFGELTAPDLRVENRSSSVFGDRSAVELRVSVEELDGMVASARSWHSNLYWLSPHWVVARMEREAVGLDDERYAWSWLDVYKFDGRLSSACRFELGDEEAAFAFAEEQVRASASRLAVANRASGTASTITAALCAGDPDRASSCFSKDFVYDDRRQLSGDPIWGGAQLRLACERILAQYNRFVDRVLAVRGEHLVLGWSRWSNDSGYATTQLAVNEIGDDGKVLYQVRFDEDDFAGAYDELTRRYCVGQDGEFADAVSFTTEWLMALNDRDFDRVFGELTAPGLRLENRSSSVFPDRSVADLRATYEELNGMMASMRSWTSAEYWPSPDCVVNRHERQAVGRDGEKYSWSRIYVTEIHNGRMSSLCQFDVDDEDSAIAYAEERVRADASPLAVTNRAKQTWDALNHLANAQDFDGLAACFSPSLVNDDRRRWSGHALNDMRTAAERVAEQYTHLDMRSLAVRGDRLHLGRTRYVNDSGFESTAFWVIEVDDDGRIVYLSRFDDDAFEDAYRDFEQRYYTGEGAAFADLGALSTEWVAAVNRGDLDRAFTEFTSPDASFENRSHTAFPDPTVSDPGDSFRALQALVASSRTWASAVRHLSPHWSIVRLEREAVGPDDEQYAWTWLHVAEIRNGRCTSSFLFDPDDEDTAFAYAEERVRRTASLEP